jgi:hypothetical protein
MQYKSTMPAATYAKRYGSPVTRFFNRVCVTDTCWLWLGARSSGGGRGPRYGSFRVRDQNYKAHRYAYELLVGPIPKGLTLDHLCNVKHCVNPDHLEPVTNRENILRLETAVARQHLEATHCPKGHPYSGPNLKRRQRGWRGCRTCAGWSGLKEYQLPLGGR